MVGTFIGVLLSDMYLENYAETSEYVERDNDQTDDAERFLIFCQLFEPAINVPLQSKTPMDCRYIHESLNKSDPDHHPCTQQAPEESVVTEEEVDQTE